MKLCPSCGREFPDNVKFCQSDGTALRSKSASADLVGQVIADRYHIVKKLGEGGMGAVYLGEHVKMGRKSAIKVMAASMSQDPDAISRFNREAANASRISHVNVCQVYDFGETPEGLIYLAMEFIEGKSLKDVIEEEGALNAVRAASILKQSAEALQAAHDLGIVHRDIKPDNIMVVKARDGSDVVKVVDFGIARAVGGDESGQKVTKTGLVVGTPEYMSPEQLSGDKLDGRSDIYSLALVLYRMLTGELPFKADSAQEVMIKRLTDDPLPLEEARPDLSFPPKLQLVMNNALARMPAERYQSASEFGRDTMDAVAGMAPPQTRVAPAQAPEGATQLMSNEDVAAATRQQQAKKSTASKPPRRDEPVVTPSKKSMVVPVLGGVGAVGALGVVAFLMLNKGGATNGVAANPDTTKQVAITPPAPAPTPAPQPAAPPPAAPPANPGTRPATPPPAPPPVSPPSPGVNVEDTLNLALTADRNQDRATARRLGRWVYSSSLATNDQKAEAAEIVATTYDDDNDRALEWLRNGLNYATGSRRVRMQNAINALSGQP